MLGIRDLIVWNLWVPCKLRAQLWVITVSGLQITVGHRTMADQNLPVSNKIATLVGHFVRPSFCCNIWLYQLQIKFYFLICYSFECTFVFMSNQIFLSSDQNGALVGHMSFQGKKVICSPAVWLWFKWTGFETWPKHCIAFFGKALHSNSASFHPGV